MSTSLSPADPPRSLRGRVEAPTALLSKDYDLKVKYLTDHFGRMWTRFNFFLTLESGLIGGKFFFGDGKLSVVLSVTGAVLAVVWYVFGAEDRYLVRVYRAAVRRAWAARVAEANSGQDHDLVAADAPVPFGCVGEHDQPILDSLRREDSQKGFLARLLEQASGWRIDSLSTTKLAALFPLSVLFVWIVLIIGSR